MMKFFKYLLVMSLCLTGCNQKTVNGWYEDYNSALKASKSTNRNLFILVNSNKDTLDSKNGLKVLLNSNAFTKAVSKDFVCVHFDFTDEAYKKTVVPEGATSKEQKMAERLQAMKKRQFMAADFFAVQETPCVVLASKEGYYIETIYFDFISDNYQGYVSRLNSEAEEIASFQKRLQSTIKGSNLEKVKAIDDLYNSTTEPQRLLLGDLSKKVLSLDKNNQSGLVSKHLTAVAHAEAYPYIIALDTKNAGIVYEKYASDKRLAPSDAQYMYYYAAQFQGSKGNNFDKVISLFQKAIDAYPDSENVAKLNNCIDNVNKIKKDYNTESISIETDNDSIDNETSEN